MSKPSPHQQVVASVRQVPQGLSSPKWQVPPDGTSIVYSGPLELRIGSLVHNLSGRIMLRWLPIQSLRFEGAAQGTDLFTANSGRAQLRVPGQRRFLPVAITKVSSNLRNTHCSGVINQAFHTGSARSGRSLAFHLVNFHEYVGQPVRYGTLKQPTLTRGRIQLSSQVWRITLDQKPDIAALYDNLRSVGGVKITHSGLACRTDGRRFSRQSAADFADALRCCFAFVRGFWCGPVLWSAADRSRRTRVEWASWRTTPWQSVGSWFPRSHADGLSGALDGFLQRWSNTVWHEPLPFAVHWYVEANSAGSAMETRLVLAQVALELLSWVRLVEEKKTLTSRAFRPINGADKIRLLLEDLVIPTGFPSEFAALKKFARRCGLPDGPAAFITLRNALVHPKSSKRALVASIESVVRFQALQLALSYIELAVLALVGYKGYYVRRVYDTWVGAATVRVPWVLARGAV